MSCSSARTSQAANEATTSSCRPSRHTVRPIGGAHRLLKLRLVGVQPILTAPARAKWPLRAVSSHRIGSTSNPQPWPLQQQPPATPPSPQSLARRQRLAPDVRAAAAYTAAYPLPQRSSSSLPTSTDSDPTASSPSYASSHTRLSRHQQSHGLTLEALVAQGAALSLIHEPAALLNAAEPWMLSSHLRQALEQAVRSGIKVALVQFPQLHQVPGDAAGSTSSSRWKGLHRMHHQQGLADGSIDPAALSTAVPFELSTGDQRYLLLLQPPPENPTSEHDQLAERRNSHASASTSGASWSGQQPRGGPLLQAAAARIYSAALQQVQPSFSAPVAAPPAAAPSGAVSGAAAAAAGSARDVLTVPFYARTRTRPLQQEDTQLSSSSQQLTASPAGVQLSEAAEVLTARLRCCTRASMVQQLVEQHWERLDHIHISATVVTLARLHQSATTAATTSSSSSSSSSSASISSRVQPGYGATAGSTTSSSSSSSSNHVSRIFANSLMLLAEQHLGHMQSRQISSTLWGVAVLGWHTPADWVARFADAAEGHLQRGTAPQGFANLAWSFATLDWQPSLHWWHSFYRGAQPHLREFKPQELSSMLWALGTLRAKPPANWTAAALQAGAAMCTAANPQALSNMVWGFAMLGVVPDPHWVSAVQYAARRHAAAFTPKGLANLLWGMGVMTGCRSTYSKVAAIAGTAGTRLQQQQQGQRHGVRQEMGSSQHQQHSKAQHWMLPPMASRVSPAAASSSGPAVAAAAAATVNPEHQWLTELVAVVQRQLHTYPGQALTNVLWALAALQYNVPEQLLAKSSQAAYLQLPYVTGATAASLLWAYGKTGAKLPEAWVVKALGRVVADVGSCSPRHLANAVEGAALWVRRQQQQQQGRDLHQLQQQESTAEPASSSLKLHSGIAQHLEQLMEASLPQLLRFGVLEVCEVGRALVSLGVTPSPAWQDMYCLSTAQLLRKMQPTHFGLVLRVLAAWQTTPDAGWTATFFAAATQCLPQFKPGDVSSVLAALAAGHLQLSAEQLQPLLEQLLQAELQPQPLVQALAALAALGYRPPEPWLQRLWLVSEPLLCSCTAPQLAHVAAGFVALRITPPVSWAASFHAACSQLLTQQAVALAPISVSEESQAVVNPTAGSFDQESALTVLWATAIMHRRPPPAVLAQLVAAAGQQLSRQPFKQCAKGYWAAAELGAFTAVFDSGLLQLLILPTSTTTASSSSSGSQEQSALTVAAAADVAAPSTTSARPFADISTDALQELHLAWLQQLLSYSPQELQAADLFVLLYVARSLVQLQQSVPHAWASAFAAALQQQLGDASPPQLLLLLRAVPLLGGAGSQPQLVAALLSALQPALHSYSPAMLTELVAALEAAGCTPDAEWMQQLCRQVLAPQLPSLRGWQVAAVLRSLARLRYAPDPSFLGTAAQVAAAKLQYIQDTVVLADLLWALTTLSWRPSKRWVTRLVTRCCQLGVEEAEPAQLVRLAWCFATLQRHPGMAWSDAAMVALGQKLHLLEPQSLADLLWSWAALEERPPKPWLDSFLAESQQLLPSFPPAALVRLMWALALLRQRPTGSWVAALLRELPEKLPRLTAPQLSWLLWSLASLNVELSGPLLQQVAGAAEATVAQLNAEQVGQLLWSLDRLDDSQHKVWAKRIGAAARQQLVPSSSLSSSSSRPAQHSLVAVRPRMVLPGTSRPLPAL